MQHNQQPHYLSTVVIHFIPILAILLKNPDPKHFSVFHFTVVASIACPLYAVIFLKLWSYVQVNRWCRISAFNRPAKLAKQARHPSLLNLNNPAASASSKYNIFLVILNAKAGNVLTLV